MKRRYLDKRVSYAPMLLCCADLRVGQLRRAAAVTITE